MSDTPEWIAGLRLACVTADLPGLEGEFHNLLDKYEALEAERERASDHYATTFAEVEARHAALVKAVREMMDKIVNELPVDNLDLPNMDYVIELLDAHDATNRKQPSTSADDMEQAEGGSLNGMKCYIKDGVLYRQPREHDGPNRKIFGGFEYRIVTDSPDDAPFVEAMHNEPYACAPLDGPYTLRHMPKGWRLERDERPDDMEHNAIAEGGE
jgi:hypothetical protein